MIKMWEFHEAPVKYQEYSKHGGDEDWIVLASHKENSNFVDWMVERVAVCDVDKYVIEEDGQFFDLYITAH